MAVKISFFWGVQFVQVAFINIYYYLYNYSSLTAGFAATLSHNKQAALDASSSA